MGGHAAFEIAARQLPGNTSTPTKIIYAIQSAACIFITEAHGGPWPTRDVLPTRIFGAASGVHAGFRCVAISITDFSAPVE